MSRIEFDLTFHSYIVAQATLKNNPWSLWNADSIFIIFYDVIHFKLILNHLGTIDGNCHVIIIMAIKSLINSGFKYYTWDVVNRDHWIIIRKSRARFLFAKVSRIKWTHQIRFLSKQNIWRWKKYFRFSVTY